MRVVSYRCPVCSEPLARHDTRWGTVWSCTACAGICLNTSVLKRSKPEAFGHAVWLAAQAATVPSELGCPSCSIPMKRFHATGVAAEGYVCRPDQFFWLDQRLLGELREQRAPALSKEAAIACAQLDAETQRERYRALDLEYDADMLSLDFLLD